jgi:hypothetical protein
MIRRRRYHDGFYDVADCHAYRFEFVSFIDKMGANAIGAYEVKTGHVELSKKARAQLADYKYAVNSRQIREVVYLNVAFRGRAGFGPSFSRALNRHHVKS